MSAARNHSLSRGHTWGGGQRESADVRGASTHVWIGGVSAGRKRPAILSLDLHVDLQVDLDPPRTQTCKKLHQ